MIADAALFLAGFAAGCVASISGFGIGSILAPVLATDTGMRMAVVLVAAPHAAATGLRFLMLRSSVDKCVLVQFGLLSAAGAFGGAFLHNRVADQALTILFAGLLLLVGVAGLTGGADRVRFHGPTAWAAGALSGFLGGLAGNQGGIRSGALLGFPLSRDAFVATATAVALIVDAVRLPVYVALDRDVFSGQMRAVAIMTVAALAGTLAGQRVLGRIPQARYRQVISLLLIALAAGLVIRLY